MCVYVYYYGACAHMFVYYKHLFHFNITDSIKLSNMYLIIEIILIKKSLLTSAITCYLFSGISKIKTEMQINFQIRCIHSRTL